MGVPRTVPVKNTIWLSRADIEYIGMAAEVGKVINQLDPNTFMSLTSIH